jgi:hypothetical protein
MAKGLYSAVMSDVTIFDNTIGAYIHSIAYDIVTLEYDIGIHDNVFTELCIPSNIKPV